MADRTTAPLDLLKILQEHLRRSAFDRRALLVSEYRHPTARATIENAAVKEERLIAQIDVTLRDWE